jgi:hypothetical protein
MTEGVSISQRLGWMDAHHGSVCSMVGSVDTIHQPCGQLKHCKCQQGIVDRGATMEERGEGGDRGRGREEGREMRNEKQRE